MPNFGLRFLFPWVFLALPLLFLLPRGRHWPLRLGVSLLLFASLAQPLLHLPQERLTLVIDLHDGVGRGGLEAAQALAGERFHNVVFYAGQSRSHALSRRDPALPALSPAERQALAPAEADLAQALNLAQGSGAGRILLLSSGLETHGNALAALPDVPIDVYALEPLPNARLANLLLPDEVSQGEEVIGTAVVETDVPTRVTLEVQLGQTTLEPIVREVPAGRTPLSFAFTAPAEGTLELQASILVDYPQPTADDSQRALLQIVQSPPVLVINDPAMALLLRTQGFEVLEGSPADLRAPLPYPALVVREGAAAFSEGQIALMADHVRSGGGLLMTGGEASFGLSGWYRTALEAVLPVSSALREETEQPQIAIVMVLDRSGSMRAENPSRMNLAQQGAVALIEQAYVGDLIGLVVFDHTHEWIFRPRYATDSGKRIMTEAVRRLYPGGGTILGPAYREALETLRATEAAVKHIIILSDGEFFDGSGQQGLSSMGARPDFAALAAEGLADGITTTTIGIGEANMTTIAAIAAAGGGRFYEVRDTRNLPQIFTDEAVPMPRSAVREASIVPRLYRHPFTVDLSNPPPLSAYIATELKPDAEMLLEALDGEPLFALGRHGLGRTAALTTDLNSFAGAFAAWPELPGLLSTTVRWLQATPQPFSSTLRPDGSGLRIIVDAVSEGQYLNDEALTVLFEGERTAMQQTAPGRYEARLEGTTAGTVAILRGSEIVARQSVNPAAGRAEDGAARLAELARASGGNVVPSLAEYAPPPSRGEVGLWPLLAGLALGLFLLELLYRRLSGRQPLPVA